MNAITAPGLYDLDAETYHADPCPEPSLSSGILSTLLSKSPRHAFAAHPRLSQQREDEKERRLDFGAAAHAMLLGKGRDLAVLNFDAYRSGDAKKARDKAYETGKTPILAADYELAVEMVGAAKWQIRQIEEIAPAFEDAGRSEVVIAWQENGLWCRGMADRLLIDESRVLMIDYKTTEASAAPAAVSWRLFDMAYDIQAAWYRRGLAFVYPGIRRFDFALVTQEKEPPFALSAVTLDMASWQLAEKKIRTGLGLWQQCMRTDTWPAYPLKVATAELPASIENRWLEREQNDEELAGLGHGFATLSDIHHPDPKPITEPV